MTDDKNLVDSLLNLSDHFDDEADEKLKVFSEELEVINDPKIRSFVRSILKMADPFWVSPASLVVGNHPLDEYGPEGMVIHTKRVFRIIAFLMATVELTTEEADCLLAATLLHDITKAYWQDDELQIVNHDPMHPYTVDGVVRYCRLYDEENNIKPPQDNSLEISMESLELILRLIRHSHGIFSPIPETIPKTQLENLLFMADYLAANLHFIIDGPEVVDERWMV